MIISKNGQMAVHCSKSRADFLVITRDIHKKNGSGFPNVNPRAASCRKFLEHSKYLNIGPKSIYPPPLPRTNIIYFSSCDMQKFAPHTSVLPPFLHVLHFLYHFNFSFLIIFPPSFFSVHISPCFSFLFLGAAHSPRL
jgi:hypothetical protein